MKMALPHRHQLLNATGTESLNRNNATSSSSPWDRSLDDNDTLSALLKGKLELIVTSIVERSIMPFFEQSIRRVVKEEIVVALEKLLTSRKQNPGNEKSTLLPQNLKLQFLNELPGLVWTGKNIEGEESSLIKVALVDGITGQIVTTGQEAEVNVEIVVLEGDCGGGEGENWTHEEFKSKIVRELNGKKSILRGNTFLKLKEGIGFISDVSFAHSADWMKNQKFRLGARVVDAVFETNVIEAKTGSFILKDRRGTWKGKNQHPLPSDEVWRLEKIHRGGAYHKRLRAAKINTLKDFVTYLSINPKRLQNILGVRATDKVWKVIVNHAQRCVVDKGIYLYHDPSYEQKLGAVFNAAGQLMGLTTKSQYVPVDQLSEDKKVEGQKLLMAASENWEQVISFEDEASLISTHRLPTTSATNSSHPPSQAITIDSNCTTSPLINGQVQPCSFPPVSNSYPGTSGGTNNLDNSELETEGNNARNSPDFPIIDIDFRRYYLNDLNPQSEMPYIEMHSCLYDTKSSGACNSPDNPIMDEDFWQSCLNDLNSQPEMPCTEMHSCLYDTRSSVTCNSPDDLNPQSEMPYIEMHSEQHGSGSGILVVTSQTVSIDRTQKIWPQVATLLRRLSIRRRISAPELGVHTQKKQRYF